MIDQQPQNIAFDAKVVGHNMPRQISFSTLSVARPYSPTTFPPRVALCCGDFFGQVHTLKAGKISRLRQGIRFVNPLTRHQTTT